MSSIELLRQTWLEWEQDETKAPSASFALLQASLIKHEGKPSDAFSVVIEQYFEEEILEAERIYRMVLGEYWSEWSDIYYESLGEGAPQDLDAMNKAWAVDSRYKMSGDMDAWYYTEAQILEILYLYTVDYCLVRLNKADYEVARELATLSEKMIKFYARPHAIEALLERYEKEKG